MDFFQTPAPGSIPTFPPVEGISTPEPSPLPETSSSPLESPGPEATPGISFIDSGVQNSIEAMSLETYALRQDIQELASQIVATQGYMNTSTYQLISDIVSGASYRYHIAYRYDDDSYNAYLYMSDDVDVNGMKITLKDAVLCQLYRYRPGSGFSWRYLYQTSAAGNVELELSSNSMAYTNILPDYPILGGRLSPESAVSANMLYIAVAAVIGFFIARIFRRG